jgi:endonuclease/exonuclease/phosphatase family metal-dependent hydrolase
MVPTVGPGPDVVVASFNVHAGIDGWARPFDVAAACRRIDADVVVVQEDWVPEGAPGVAAVVGQALGYSVITAAMATGRRSLPHASPGGGWGPLLDRDAESHAFFLDGHRPRPTWAGSPRYAEAQPGALGLAMLSRLPILDSGVIELGRHPRDRCDRRALVLHLENEGSSLTVVGTHMPHLPTGARAAFGRLRRELSSVPGGIALAGDMNLWGPPVRAMFRGWRPAVRGATWPSGRPHSQIDHILVRGPVEAVSGEVLPERGSDHRPVRARLAT